MRAEALRPDLSSNARDLSAPRPPRADIPMARRGLEAVLVQQRAVLLRAEAAERERLDVAIAHRAQPAEHLLGARDRCRVRAEADVLRERPQLDRNLVCRNAPAGAF